MNKIDSTVQDALERLDVLVRERFQGRKREVIDDVRAQTPQGGEQEGRFVKLYLENILKDIFSHDALVIEGVDSAGEAQYKNRFLGNKPAPDFVVNDLKIVGEVKYERLAPRIFGTAVGQALIYMRASTQEEHAYRYGIVIYFTVQDEEAALSQQEQSFLEELWRNQGVWCIVV